jgi:hypothetical protein
MACSVSEVSMRIPYRKFVFCVIFALVLMGCRRDPLGGVDVPEQLTLYSIDGRDFEPGKQPKVDEKFHGYPVLGKVEITDAGKRKEIIAALKEGLAHDDGSIAACFWPRHAIRVVDKGRTIDYVICFQCYQVQAYDGNAKSVKPVTREPQPVLNRHLKEAGIPLAPGMSRDEN